VDTTAGWHQTRTFAVGRLADLHAAHDCRRILRAVEALRPGTPASALTTSPEGWATTAPLEYFIRRPSLGPHGVGMEIDEPSPRTGLDEPLSRGM
jgi:hypothetical protein